MLTPATRASTVWLPLMCGSRSAGHLLELQSEASLNDPALRSECRSSECSSPFFSQVTVLASSNHTWALGAVLRQACLVPAASDGSTPKKDVPESTQVWLPRCSSQLQHLLAAAPSRHSFHGSSVSYVFSSRNYSSYKDRKDSSRQGSLGRFDRAPQPGLQSISPAHSAPRFTPISTPLPRSNQHVESTHRPSILPTPVPLTYASLQQIRTFDQMRYALSTSLALTQLPQLLQAMSHLVQLHRMQGMYEALPLEQHMAENITLRLLAHVHKLSSTNTTELLWCMAHLGLPNLGNTQHSVKTINHSNRHRGIQPVSAADSTSDGNGSSSVAQALADSICPLQSGLLARLKVLGWGEFSKQDASRVVWSAAKLQQRQRTSPLKWQLTPGTAPGLGDMQWWDDLATAMLPAGLNPIHPGQEGGGLLQVEDWADVVWAFGLVAYKGPTRHKLCSAAADALLQRNTVGLNNEEEQQSVQESEAAGAFQKGLGGGYPSEMQRAGLRDRAQQGTGLGDGFFLNANSGRISGLLHSLAVMDNLQPEVMDRGIKALLEHGPSVRAKDWLNVLWACATLQHPHPELFKAALGHLVQPGVVLKPAEFSTLLWSCAKIGSERQLIRNFLQQYIHNSGQTFGSYTNRERYLTNMDAAGSNDSSSSSKAHENFHLSRFGVNAAASTMWAIAEFDMLGPADGVVLNAVIRPLLSAVHSSFPPPHMLLQPTTLPSTGTDTPLTQQQQQQPHSLQSSGIPMDSRPHTAAGASPDLFAKHKLALIQVAQVHYALRNASAPADLVVRPDLVARGTVFAADERRTRKVARDHQYSPVYIASKFLRQAVGTRGLLSVAQEVPVLNGLVAAGLVVCLQRQGQDGVRQVVVEFEGALPRGRSHRERRQGTSGLQLSLLQHAFGAVNVVTIGTEDVDWLTLDEEAGAKFLLDVLGADE